MNDNQFLIYPVKGQPPISTIVTNQIIEYSREFKRTGCYKPWISIKGASVCSVGSKTENKKSDYAHETMSSLESKFVRYLKFLPNVIDIRTQFPLFPIQETLKIAADLNVKHPSFMPTGNIKEEHQVKHANVMTTDKIVEYADGNGERQRSPIALKELRENGLYSSKETKHQNIVNKLEIERVYWEKNNRTHRIITQNKPYFGLDFVKNLKRAERYIDLDITPTLKADIKKLLLEFVPKARSYTLGVIEDEVAQRTDQKVSLIHTCVLHLIWHQELLWDLDREIAIHKRIPLKKGAKKCVWQ
ncbi:TnsA endonuclease N-terminal domain-containing protein [Alteromonas stellipolaris]|uniref:TnsA endonuclease N-terminal domain-containing protein n=1 Tax=Alteromonas stellipolaris TaxID=233316 RepID=UPI001DBE0131|nr:TnsA endonuclease N-terminal domain-containing protein [Alteromonas stellipolaris]MBZ2163329.1 TnsA endonuclease N-terminal domain-containing protein [Alteromonas stellipolaris]